MTSYLFNSCQDGQKSTQDQWPQCKGSRKSEIEKDIICILRVSQKSGTYCIGILKQKCTFFGVFPILRQTRITETASKETFLVCLAISRAAARFWLRRMSNVGSIGFVCSQDSWLYKRDFAWQQQLATDTTSWQIGMNIPQPKTLNWGQKQVWKGKRPHETWKLSFFGVSIREMLLGMLSQFNAQRETRLTRLLTPDDTRFLE